MKWFLLVVLAVFFEIRAMTAQTLILYGEKTTEVQKNAASELAADINRVCGVQVNAEPFAEKKSYAEYKQLIFVGTIDSHEGIRKLVDKGFITLTQDDPGPEAFVLQTLKNEPQKGMTTLVIAGHDDRGTCYGVYEISRRVLGIDPLEYWTGKQPEKLNQFIIPEISFREKSPLFPLRGYFDNDDDLIANWKGKKLIIEFDTWKEMINSLARLRYNYIDLHDTFGRAEFWNWDYYRRLCDYHTDLDLVDKIIDYAHSKGMLVQAPMYLGWEFYSLDYNKICLSKFYDDWMDVYKYYLTETPIGKCDLFLQRPRDPWWDKAYECCRENEAGMKVGPLMTRMFDGLLALVEKYRPGGKVICDLWSEGRIMWRAKEFTPAKRVNMLWADGGYGYYDEWPEDYKGHNFGIYIHAGYWLNNVMQDPYPEVIKKSSVEAARRGMTHDYFVNGQNFKNFILNLEACAGAAWNPFDFDAEKFYLQWTTRYFGKSAAPEIVASLKTLHEAHKPIGGFAKLMGYTVRTLKNLERGKFKKIDMNPLKSALAEANKSLLLAQKAGESVPEEAKLVYDDQILFPAEIFKANIEFALSVAKMMNAVTDMNDTSSSSVQRDAVRKNIPIQKNDVRDHLADLRGMLEKGSDWKKWDGWYKPEHFRVFTPPPTMDELEQVFRSLAGDES